jgi:hypothetical protein
LGLRGRGNSGHTDDIGRCLLEQHGRQHRDADGCRGCVQRADLLNQLADLPGRR